MVKYTYLLNYTKAVCTVKRRVVRYLGCSLVGGFTVLLQLLDVKKNFVIGKSLRLTFLGNFGDYYSINLGVGFLQIN